MRVKSYWDFRIIIAIACFSVFTFCLLKYFEPVEALDYPITGQISIPSIELASGVSDVPLTDGELKTPAKHVGSYSKNNNKTLLFGHSTTVFSNLIDATLGDEIIYNDYIYNIYQIEVSEKSAISMKKLLAPSDKDTIVLMTCYGELYDNGDSSHRLIIFA